MSKGAALHCGLLLLVSLATSTEARQIRITPTSGDYTDIEAARAGDEVIIAPGTYRYRVYLPVGGTAAAPIIIRGEDPANPPVFDYTGQELQTWPGSYPSAAPDAVRHAWYITGEFIVVRDIEVQGASNLGTRLSSAGFRFFNVTSRGERLRSHHNEIGVEFANGGTIESSVLSDNLVSVEHFGGEATVRNSLLQRADINLYSGASQLTVEATWFEPARTYHLNVGACAYFCGGATNADAVPRNVTLRGNVFRDDGASPANWMVLLDARIGGPSLDGTGTNLLTDVRLLHNTFVGPPTGLGAAPWAVFSQGNAITFSVHAYGNAIHHLGSACSLTGAAITGGVGNWATAGTLEPFPGTGFGPSPLFADEAGFDFRPTAVSPLARAAADSMLYAPATPPGFQPSLTPLAGPRPRSQSTDIGAFEAAPAVHHAFAVGCDCQSMPGSVLGLACFGLAIFWKRERRLNVSRKHAVPSLLSPLQRKG